MSEPALQSKPEVAEYEYIPELHGVYIRIDDENGEVDTVVRPSKTPPDVMNALKEGDLELANRLAAAYRKPPRKAEINRETAETKISLALNLDGTGKSEIETGVGFFEHMLTLFSKHSLIDLTVKAEGDLHVDAHHTVEDVGICLGKALSEALGNKAGIRRYGAVTAPMDETLVTSAVDLSGRPFLVWKAEVPVETLGNFNASLAEEFWQAVAANAAFNLHVILHHGKNTHHIIEAIFKATARALREGVEYDPRSIAVPSTKGTLT